MHLFNPPITEPSDEEIDRRKREATLLIKGEKACNTAYKAAALRFIMDSDLTGTLRSTRVQQGETEFFRVLCQKQFWPHMKCQHSLTLTLPTLPSAQHPPPPPSPLNPLPQTPCALFHRVRAPATRRPLPSDTRSTVSR